MDGNTSYPSGKMIAVKIDPKMLPTGWQAAHTPIINPRLPFPNQLACNVISLKEI